MEKNEERKTIHRDDDTKFIENVFEMRAREVERQEITSGHKHATDSCWQIPGQL